MLRFIILIQLLVLVLGSAKAAGQSPVDSPSLWNLNDSVVRLEVDGSTRRIYYAMPRAGLREVGVAEGTLLFQGTLYGNTLNGVAYVFSKTCGALSYPVTGSASQQQMYFSGRAPLVNPATCQLGAYRDDSNIFRLLAVSSPSIDQMAQARALGLQEGQAISASQLAELESRLQQTRSRASELETAYQQAEQRFALVQNERNQALSRAVSAEQEVNGLRQILQKHSDDTSNVTGSISIPAPSDQELRIARNSKEGLLIGSAFNSFVVSIVSFIIEAFKTMTKKSGSFRKELAIETLASLISSVLLSYVGIADNVKLLSIPFGVGLSFAIILSVKHRAESNHAHSVLSFA